MFLFFSLISRPSVSLLIPPLFPLFSPLLSPSFLSSLLDFALRPTMSLDGPSYLSLSATQIVSDGPDTAACVRTPFVVQRVGKLELKTFMH